MAWITCPKCKKPYQNKEKTCPDCGWRPEGADVEYRISFRTLCWLGLAGLILLMILIGHIMKTS